MSVWISRVGATLNTRFWLVGSGATTVAFLVLGLPTAVIPNPWFSRMTSTEMPNVAVLVASAPLIGVLVATYLAPVRDVHPATDGAPGRASLASVGAFLAIGCPICNKVVVALLGVSGALTVFAPLQPIIGAASVALLIGSVAWRLRERALDCPRCAPSATA